MNWLRFSHFFLATLFFTMPQMFPIGHTSENFGPCFIWFNFKSFTDSSKGILIWYCFAFEIAWYLSMFRSVLATFKLLDLVKSDTFDGFSGHRSLREQIVVILKPRSYLRQLCNMFFSLCMLDFVAHFWNLAQNPW